MDSPPPRYLRMKYLITIQPQRLGDLSTAFGAGQVRALAEEEGLFAKEIGLLQNHFCFKRREHQVQYM